MNVKDSDGSGSSREGPEKPTLVGIRGWLILVAIWVVAVPVVSAIGLAQQVGFLGSATWQIMMTPGSAAYRPMLKPMVMGEIAAAAIVLVWSIILAILFFQRKSRFPNMAIGFIVFATAARILDVSLGSLMYGVSLMDETWSIAGLLAAAAIGIVYFRRSKRVRATFAV